MRGKTFLKIINVIIIATYDVWSVIKAKEK